MTEEQKEVLVRAVEDGNFDEVRATMLREIRRSERMRCIDAIRQHAKRQKIEEQYEFAKAMRIISELHDRPS